MATIEAVRGSGAHGGIAPQVWAPMAWLILTFGVAVLRAPGLLLRFAGACPPSGLKLLGSVLYVLALLFIRVFPYLLIAIALCSYSLGDAAYERMKRWLKPGSRRSTRVLARETAR